MKKEKVILVDDLDNEIGTMEKMEAHRKGLLHRAFSIFVFNSAGDILLQKRDSKKYHSGGLWSNTCCSHPRPEETLFDATNRRLEEEMGMKTKLTPIFSFLYRAHLDHELTEHELDHVFIGYSDELPIINRAEVEDYSYISPELLALRMKTHADEYSAWLKICFDELMNHMKKNEKDFNVPIENKNTY